jgi:hypothetical protein
MTGLQLWNGSPLVNGVNLSLLKIGGNIIVTSATTTGLSFAYGTGQATAPTGFSRADRAPVAVDRCLYRSCIAPSCSAGSGRLTWFRVRIR